ncbi:MAG: cell filamentation protein Fic [Nitrososphaera sp.]|nr:cell filamentation protein Fic [Nitrososphaera sp.]
MPDNLPPRINYDESLTSLVSEASIQLSNLSGIGKLAPNPRLLIRPYLRREAVLSSKIEGTQASIVDVFRFEAGGISGQKENEAKRIMEVVNYVHALDECLDAVRKDAPIDLKMIKNAHKILMQNVRGEEIESGKFRIVQNWIGVEGTRIEDATYVPPAPEYLNDLLAGLEKFIQNPPGRISVLVQCAMMHYQFEAIHPFSDGNGRIGRLLISLLLAQRKVLDLPLLYLSAYIERNKLQYYSLLLKVSQQSAWEEWLRFFLYGVISQASDAVNSIQRLMALKAAYDQKLRSKKASGSMTRITDYLFSNPIITISKAAEYLDVTYPPAKNAVDKLKEMGILAEQNDRERGRIFVAKEIMDILS